MSLRNAVLFTLLVAYGLTHAQETSIVSDQGYEVAMDLNAADVLPEDILQGEHHSVIDRVRNDGYLNYYTIKSDYGDFEAASTLMLRVRIREIDALARLDELSKTDVFINAAVDADIDHILSLKQAVTHPISTIAGIPRGIGRMFNRYTGATDEAGDGTREYVAAHADDDGRGEDDKAAYEKKALELTKRYYSVTDAERRLSEDLGTDPYTSNETLRKAIKDMAWAHRLGRGSSQVVASVIPIVGYIRSINDAVWSEDPYALRDRNRAILKDVVSDEALIDEYLKNPWMSPSQQTLVVAAIAELQNVAGRDGILRQALNPITEAEVGYFVRSVTLLTWFHKNRTPIVEISAELAIPGGITADGKTVLLFPSDYVYWTEPMAQAATEYRVLGSNDTGHGRGLWVLGLVSDRTESELKEMGYELHTNFADLILPVTK